MNFTYQTPWRQIPRETEKQRASETTEWRTGLVRSHSPQSGHGDLENCHGLISLTGKAESES